MEQATVQNARPKSKGPLIATIVVLAVIAAGLAIAIAFFVGRESNEPVVAGESTSTTTTTLGPEQLATLSEEELAALVNQVMTEVEATADELMQASAETTDTTETVEVVVTAENLDDLVAYAEVLLDYYASTYGSYAAAAANELSAMESELAAISASTDEILALLESGASATTDVLEQVQAKAAELSSLTGQLQGAAQQWQTQLGSIREQIEAPTRPDVSAPDVSAPDVSPPERSNR